MTTEKEIVVSGDKALEIADALNATTLRILRLVRKELYPSQPSPRS